MRNFNHIILDFENSNSSNTSKYWLNKSLQQSNFNSELIYNVDSIKKLSRNAMQDTHLNDVNQYLTLNNLTTNTITYPLYDHLVIYNQSKKNPLYNKYISSSYPGKDYTSFSLENNVKSIILNVSGNTSHSFKANTTLNVNFLRKERLYTKLKYSRSPAYDIVSGGAAAILAGFVGFLISEKFGFELVDSGDFYFLFMYIVFASFSIRPLLITMNYTNKISSIFSVTPIFTFYIKIVNFLLKKFK